MQPIRQLMDVVSELVSPQACLFTPNDLRSILPDHSATAFNTLLSRAAREGHFTKICRGLYHYEKAMPDRGLVLLHAVSKLRPLALNYLSLETVLSDAGVIWINPLSIRNFFLSISLVNRAQNRITFHGHIPSFAMFFKSQGLE